MNIGIFGGSFNPIHYGHIALAEAALREGFVDEVWLLISPHNPLKPSASLADETERLRLAKMALEQHRRDADAHQLPTWSEAKAAHHIVASDFEFSLERPSFTWQTLQALQTHFPQHRFSLIIGGDNWECFDRWRNWKNILLTTPIIVYPRQDSIPTRREGFPAPRVLDAPLFPFSSTDIRRALQANASDQQLAEWLPADIINSCRGLYGQNTIEG